MGSDKQHFRHILLFYYRKGKNAVQARKKLTDVYEEGVLTVRQCQNWFAKFRSDNFDVEDAPRSGRPVEADKDAIKTLVDANRRITTCEIGLRLNLSNSTVYDHLKGLGLSSKLDAWVPHVLTERNLCRRIDVYDSLLKRHENDPFLKRIITGDEKGHGVKKVTRLKPFPKPIFTKKRKECKYYEVNTRISYAIICIGKGKSSAKLLRTVMNLPTPSQIFNEKESGLDAAIETGATVSMQTAAKEAKDVNGHSDIPVPIVGTWQKRGHTSLNGAVIATSVDTGKVLDASNLSRFCKCPNKTHNEKCKDNHFRNSESMEVSGAIEIF
ncbi:histone-lysine N-methyltransferase SETMAR [Trichonephila clavipes]|nr:histone-lysine N-methyltransferase SETMAR [Trichonephila clavipes]